MLYDVQENWVVLEPNFDVVAPRSDAFELDEVRIENLYFSYVDPIWDSFLERKCLNIDARYLKYFNIF